MEEERNLGGRPPYEPTEKDHKIVQAMAAVGIPQDDIARVIGVAPKTLREHFRETLDLAMIQADAKVASTMFAMATSGQCPAMTAMWMKCRLHWKEPQVIEHTGAGGGPIQLTQVREKIAEAVASLPEELRVLIAEQMMLNAGK